MAHGTESTEFRFVSGARSGLKREFAFALKNQSDLTGSIGRTRGKKAQSLSAAGDEAFKNPSVKRFKIADVKEEVLENTLAEKEMIQIDEKLQGEYEKPICMEESKPNMVKSPIREAVDMDMGKSLITDEPEKAQVIKISQECKLEVPVVISEDNVGRNMLLEKPLRRFTRSLLKPKEERLEASATGTTTSSGSTLLSEEACKNELTATDDGKASDAISSLKTPSRNRLEMKMSKKIALNKLPTNIRDLLDTGLLEGLRVKYLFLNKKDGGLRGTIKDGGILCSCPRCKGCKVITAYEFERHAGSAQKHASNNIYLENGNNLRDVLDACRDAPTESYEDSIKSALSSLPETNNKLCKKCKEPLSATHASKMMQFCKSCLASDDSLATPARVCVSNTRSSKEPLTPTSSGSDSVPSSSHTKRGKVTQKDIRLHKLVFDEDGLPDGTALTYFVRGLKIIEGYKKGLGIFCYHCNTEVSPSQFESHAGYGSRRKPYLNIYTSNGVSLHELSISLSKSRKLSGNDNDDLCNYCREFGDLICCDMCPRAFHQDCVGLSSIPKDKWYCPFCVNMYEREKCCEYNANAVAAGRVSGVDPIEQITKRCIRIVETNEPGGCTICRFQSFSKEFGPSTVIICDQCEKEYHVGCLKEQNMADLKKIPDGEWFCCSECEWAHTALRKLVAKGAEKIPDSLLLRVIKKKPEDTEFNVSWCVLRGKTAVTPESRSLLEKAISIFHERFDPILDAKSGSDFIPSMVQGETIRDQDFGGMYTAVLTVNSSVVSAGILRVFGQNIAEIPLVATSTDSEGRGYFQLLFACIERLLGFLNVKNIVLPSAEESKAIWTDKFGFTSVSFDQLGEYKRSCQMMVFTGTSLLHKPVPECRVVNKAAASPGKS